MRTYESMLHEVAYELGLLCESRYNGMHTRFKDVLTGKMIYLIGNYLPLNTYTACALAVDKGLTTEILNENNIPCVQHNFLHEKDFDCLSEQQNLDVFIKPIRGTSGKSIHRITTASALKTFRDGEYLHDSWCYSPTELYDIEYRISILDGECIAIYGKTKGRNDQNNLSTGAVAFEVDMEKHLDLINMAIASAKTMDIRFCNVDMFYDEKGHPKVMEINSGMCFNLVLNVSDNLYNQSKEAYKKALLVLLDEAALSNKKSLETSIR